MDLGYIVEKDCKDFFVNIEHLTPGSKCLVQAECDFCGKIIDIKYYLYLKNISSHNIFACSPKCGKNKTIKTNLEKWGVEYATQNEEIKNKTIKTNLEKWGVEYATQNEEIKNRTVQKNLEKWGVDCVFKSKEVREKSKKTLLERYGVDHNFKSKEVREKSKKTLMKSWGVDNPSKSEDIKNKKKATSLKNWGTEYPTKSEFIKNKIKITNLERLGVEYPMQSEEVREKSKRKFLENWGVIHNSQIEEVKDKMKINNLKNWGFEYTLQSPKIREKINFTTFKKYNVENALQNEEIRSKYFKIAKNINYLRYDGDEVSIFWCELGHEFKISSTNYTSRLRSKSNLCTVCYPIQNSVSIKELELLNFIKSIYSGEVIGTYRNGKEIDIYLPELKLGFEFNGLYWHSEKFAHKYYHLDKTLFFYNKGIHIIHIWEDNWDIKKDIIKSQIRNWIGKTERKIFARLCQIKVIKDRKVVSDFLENNHIQGSDRSSLKIGLYYEDELVSLMTFDNFEGRKKMEQGGWNLSRFCNKLNTNVIGGASKILKYFIKNYSPLRIISYANRDWSDGNLYKKIGFNLVNEGKPDYKYIINGVRSHKSNFKKSKLNYTITESEYTKERGLDKVWDCGKMKFELKIKELTMCSNFV